MADWTWILGPAAGGHETDLSTAKKRKATWRLRGEHEASCSLDARHPEAAKVQELATDLHVVRDKQLLYRGRVGAPQDTLGEDSHTMTLPSVDYRAVLRRRLLYDDSALTFTQVDQSDIAWALVSGTQGRVGGNLGITRGVGQFTGVKRDRTYKSGEFVGERIDLLGEVLNGFDYAVEPTSQSSLAFDVYYPSRGTDRGVIVDYGGAFLTGSRVPDPRNYANAGRYSGADTLVAQVREAPDLATLPEGRWDTQQGYTDITVQATLNERADAEHAASLELIPSWTVKLKAGWWQGPGHIWIGDTVRLIVMSGRLKTDTPLRVFELAADVGESGEEEITLTLGASRPDFARRQRKETQRLRTLERR